MRLSRRIVIWAIVGIGLIILSPILLCVGDLVYEGLKPSATEQLLAFADLPLDTLLPLRDKSWQTKLAVNIDYSPVEDVLHKRFPLGTSEQEINAFVAEQNKQCDRDKQVLTCEFEKALLPCRDTIYLHFSFDAANKLEKITIGGWSACL